MTRPYLFILALRLPFALPISIAVAALVIVVLKVMLVVVLLVPTITRHVHLHVAVRAVVGAIRHSDVDGIDPAIARTSALGSHPSLVGRLDGPIRTGAAVATPIDRFVAFYRTNG